VRTLFSSATALIAMLGKALAEGRIEERPRWATKEGHLPIPAISFYPSSSALVTEKSAPAAPRLAAKFAIKEV